MLSTEPIVQTEFDVWKFELCWKFVTSWGTKNFHRLISNCIMLCCKFSETSHVFICICLLHSCSCIRTIAYYIWILWVVSAENPHETPLVLLGTPIGLTACCMRSMQSCFLRKCDLSSLVFHFLFYSRTSKR